jgi:hypothetical protein
MSDVGLPSGLRLIFARDDIAGGYWAARRLVGPDPFLLSTIEWDATGGSSISICGANDLLCIDGGNPGGTKGARTKFRFGSEAKVERTVLSVEFRWKGVDPDPLTYHEAGVWVQWWPHSSPTSGPGPIQTDSYQCPGSTTFTTCNFSVSLDQSVLVQDLRIWMINTGQGNEVRIDYVKVFCTPLVTFCAAEL